jgi:hypothetical protein
VDPLPETAHNTPPRFNAKSPITVTVEPDQEGYDDPEWIADAAWGSLANEYGYECSFGDITELRPPG